MEIHAPHQPVHSWREFGVHIAIVTCGILIALALEGAREAWHNRHLVRETREMMRIELQQDLSSSAREMKRVSATRDRTQEIVEKFPALETADPQATAQRVMEIDNPSYFFSANSWDTSMSTGALAHMSTDEVQAYAGAAQIIRIYSGLQASTASAETRAKAWFVAHPKMTPDQQAEAIERLMVLYNDEKTLTYILPQMQEQLKNALEQAQK